MGHTRFILFTHGGTIDTDNPPQDGEYVAIHPGESYTLSIDKFTGDTESGTYTFPQVTMAQTYYTLEGWYRAEDEEQARWQIGTKIEADDPNETGIPSFEDAHYQYCFFTRWGITYRGSDGAASTDAYVTVITREADMPKENGTYIMEAGTYVIDGDVKLDGNLIIDADQVVTLVLIDGSKLDLGENSITLHDSANLFICQQGDDSDNIGKLVAKSINSVEGDYTGISILGGNLTVVVCQLHTVALYPKFCRTRSLSTF